MPSFLALLPFVIFLFFLLIIRSDLLKSSLAALLATVLLVKFYWQMDAGIFNASFIKGSLIAFDILVIIAGALFFLDILEKKNIIGGAITYLESLSKDYRVLTIVLAWLFINFLEGLAGFGTPPAIVAPLLIALGLSPLTAVTVALLGNSTAGTFGAVGTPIRVGFAGLNYDLVPVIASKINFIGIIVPIFMLWIITSHQKKRWQHFFEALPFAIFAGLAYVIPALITSYFGQEFPSIIGGLIGLILAIIVIKLGILQPKNIKVLRDNQLKKNNHLSKFRLIMPYFLLILLLIIGKWLFGNASIALEFGLKHNLALFNPGYVFFIVGAIVLMWPQKFEQKPLSLPIFLTVIKKSFNPFLVFAAMSSMVQLMANSGANQSRLPSLIAIIAKMIESEMLPFFTAFIGAFGSFITGSATVSNLMFGGILVTASQNLHFDSQLILALALVGAAAGNMIALADVLTAATVVGMQHQTVKILSKVILPCLIYIVLVGLLATAIN